MRNALAGVALATLCAAGAVGPALAEDAPELVVEGETLVTSVKTPEGHPLDEIRSGWTFRSKETRKFQLDDFDNPAFVTVDIARDLWETADGAAGKSCQSCHEDVESMKGVRAAMPKWNKEANQPWSLEMWINDCRTKRMEADAWKWESTEMLGMTALVGLQSRGMPVDPDTSGDMSTWVETGKKIYYTRYGQLNLACANCHEDNHGVMIRADHLSMGMTNGFPTYRLKWQGLGSLHRRFKGCMGQVRAKGFKRGSDEFVALEAYLAERGKGLSVETPAVRN